MIDSKLLQEAIEDAKSVRMLGLAWNEGQFCGSMKYKSYPSTEVERATCYCRYCWKSIPLENSSSHAQTCTKERSEEFNAIYRAKIHKEVPTMCEELEKRIEEGKFGKVDKYTWG